jgi:uncharacterized membrane protein YcaP (DUF421 family)
MSIWDTVLRSALAYAIMMIIARIMGKPTISQMSYHDFVASITLGAITANLAFNDKIGFWKLLAATLTFSGIAYLLLVLSMKSRFLRKWFSGKPTVLIQDGKILENNMKKVKITLDMLIQELREKNIFDLQEVQFAVLEMNGKLSILRTPESMPATKKDVLAPTDAKPAFPIELIMDGSIVGHNLKQNQLTVGWLVDQVEKKGLTVEQVNYAVIGTNGSLYLDEYEDRITHAVDKE